MEIGSEFWWSEDNLTSINHIQNNSSYVFPYGAEKMKFTSSGRGAITNILNNNNFREKKALLPAYICESVILPFEKSGFDISYYQINKDLTPNLKSVNNDFDVYFHLGYYGFNTNNLESLPIEVSNKIVIEDVTHSMFSKNYSKDINDYQVGSIRKWFGIPSGGIVIGNNISGIELSTPDNKFIQLRKKALIEKEKFINKTIESKEYLKLFSEAENILNKDVKGYEIDQDSLEIINTFNYQEMIKKRRQNYQVLIDGITENKKIKVIFEELSDTVCPMFFPIYVDERDSLRKFLINHKIYCPVHWPVPPQVKNTLDETTTYIYNNILSIPCDQRYGMDDMQRIVKVINEWLNQ